MAKSHSGLITNHAVFGMTNGPVAIGGERVCAVSEPRDKI